MSDPDVEPIFHGTFRRLPVLVEAWRWDGDSASLHEWAERTAGEPLRFHVFTLTRSLVTLDTPVRSHAALGDWVVYDHRGEWIVVRADEFEASYERLVPGTSPPSPTAADYAAQIPPRPPIGSEGA